MIELMEKQGKEQKKEQEREEEQGKKNKNKKEQERVTGNSQIHGESPEPSEFHHLPS